MEFKTAIKNFSLELLQWFGEIFEAFPAKVRLFIGMLIAANTAAFGIWAAVYLAGERADYWACLGAFLALRIVLFMANKQMPLTDENVAFMSSERTLWNLASIAVAALMVLVKWLILHLF